MALLLGHPTKGYTGRTPERNKCPRTHNGCIAGTVFLAQSTPLPASTGRAVDFLATSRPTAVKALWPNQLTRMGRICDEQRDLSAQWDACRPEAPKPLKSANVLLLAFLAHRYKLGGRRWVRQLIFGFPIVGSLSQEPTYPHSEKAPPSAGLAELFDSLSLFPLF